MRWTFFALVFVALIHCVGCGMSGPGIGRVQGPPASDQPPPPNIWGFTADKSWVSPYPTNVDRNKPHLSEDISERKLGEKPLSKDLTVDSEGRTLHGAEARQEERRLARRPELNRRSGLQSSKPTADSPKNAKPAAKP